VGWDIPYGVQNEEFSFDHPSLYNWETGEKLRDSDRETAIRDWVREFVTRMYGEEHVKDIDWEHILVTDD
jgi:hypothetical protein